MIYVLQCYYDENEKTISGVYGVYGSMERAEQASAKFLSFQKEDETYCTRKTCISVHTLNAGWYEEYWFEPTIEVDSL